ncbi:putative 2-dehydropantoate 2-reductase [Zancudomyces culisetae]|uniref:Putative 2-dehydropantoate 2-reductase n=1 Tax=Zancudomyces culisetae TaxID=1213189 RepID=A0A1R1PMY8_ZANCU|nr:putative 2-dehydropantoate 2-reductase [Zancudomyces culisetae]OMH82314.1 putative 2-dehydropantoate 2-reductase [Zancudomyces culisetae]|eukprot:OMH82107.1 putative 2-dehydropantoate 2-reductase [Zancudomyces culisetae]
MVKINQTHNKNQGRQNYKDILNKDSLVSHSTKNYISPHTFYPWKTRLGLLARVSKRMSQEGYRTRILIIGGGGVGSILGWRLQAGGAHVSMACRSNYKAIKETGFIITPGVSEPVTFHPDEVLTCAKGASTNNIVFDYVFVCTKCLPNISDPSDAILPYISSNKTVIILVQNGVGIEEPVKNKLPLNTLVSSVINVSASQTENGVITYAGRINLKFGFYVQEGQDLDEYNKQNRHTLQKIHKLLVAGDIGSTIFENIQPVRWSKVIWNGTFSPVSVLAGAIDKKSVVTLPETRDLLINAMNELCAIAEAVTNEKVTAISGYSSIEGAIENAKNGKVTYYSSMVLDFVNKRPMEHEVILRNPIIQAKKYGLETPILETLYALLTCTERSYMSSN